VNQEVTGMVDEATLQAQLDAELDEHLTAARGGGH
jgi:hypothetical protein